MAVARLRVSLPAGRARPVSVRGCSTTWDKTGGARWTAHGVSEFFASARAAYERIEEWLDGPEATAAGHAVLKERIVESAPDFSLTGRLEGVQEVVLRDVPP